MNIPSKVKPFIKVIQFSKTIAALFIPVISKTSFYVNVFTD